MLEMTGGIYETGNVIVDENAKLNISGNIIPQAWYRTILRESGKPNLTAIIILADIVYWYKPMEIRDEVTGQVVGVKKKFKSDLLQRSYQQISEQFGISKKEATNAVIFLEKLGVVRRIFRTVTMNGLVINNVLYLELVVCRLRELTYPETEVPKDLRMENTGNLPETKCSEKPEAEVTKAADRVLGFPMGQAAPSKGGPPPFKRGRVPTFKETDPHPEVETNTEITQKNTIEIFVRAPTDNNNPIQSYHSVEEQFKKQIDYHAIWVDRPYDRRLLENIVSIAVDVLTSSSAALRVNSEERPTQVVQEIYRRLEKDSVEYVMDSIKNCGSRVTNVRAVIMTALYNAAMTTTGYIVNLFAYHTASGT